MSGKLKDISTGKLLEKFGAGNHKPGSGSASAMQGMLSAQMLRTVIDLTNDPKHKKNYTTYISELLRIKKEIDSRIYVALDKLFQDDSDLFDKVIILREQRDKEANPIKKRELSIEAQKALIPATELPLEIAELCLDLGEFASYVFDNGFQSARGDSGVALQTAISGVASCLCIVDLNLRSLFIDERIEKIRERKAGIKEKYERLSLNGKEKLGILEKESNETLLYQQSIIDFRRGDLGNSIRSNSELEELVKRLQNTLWLQRDKIWKQNPPENPIEILQPDVVLKKVMNYTYLESDNLGVYEHNGELSEIAGLINKNQNLVQISRNFPVETMNFTAAHELGHALLHQQTEMHRDRPIDGSVNTPRSLEEIQADKFATYFLMPQKLLKEVFSLIFEMPTFVINEATVLAVRGGSVGAFRQQCNNIRGLARILASVDYYAGKSFNPLSKIFNVSIETMAIRLEELRLLEF